MPYWYNINSKQVETDENRGRNDEVMGPYDTEEEARNALASARENTEEWDAEDKAWDDKGATWDDSDLED